MVKHAERELEMLELEGSEEFLEIVRIFASMGHSGGSADVARTVINALLEQENLSPLTDDPSEWEHFGEEMWPEPGGIWQSNRCGRAFSKDGGKTYYLITDSIGHDDSKTVYTSKPRKVSTI
jgi:hypothetical protein